MSFEARELCKEDFRQSLSRIPMNAYNRLLLGNEEV